MTGFRFATPAALYLLWLVPAIAGWWFLVLRRREQSLSRFVSAKMRERLGPKSTVRRDAAQAAVFLAAFLLMIIAAARPQWGMREEMVYQKSRDLVVALDVSRSMLASDVHPNRLERAKADVLDLIRELRGDRIALLAFRRTGVLLCPLTTDHAFLRQTLDMISTESAPRGETDLGDAITKALAAFEPGEGSHKAIILISDGEDLAGKGVEAAERAGKAGIPIFTVGIGSRAGSRIPDPAAGSGGFLRHRGEDVLTRLNDNVLYQIAEKSGGAYVPLETAGMATVTLGTLYRDHLRRVAARETAESLQSRYIERFQVFLLPGVLLMILALSMGRGRPAVRRLSPETGIHPAGPGPAARPAALHASLRLLIAACVASAFATALAQPSSNQQQDAAQSAAGKNQVRQQHAEHPSARPIRSTGQGRDAANAARQLYNSGRYEEAAQAYLDAAKEMPANVSRPFRYNAAVSFYRAGRYSEAADILRSLALEEDSARPRFYEGLGEALYRAAAHAQGTNEAQTAAAKAANLRAAGEAFRGALRMGSSHDGPAGRNLAAVLAKLPDAEREARQADILSRYGNTPAPQIAAQMLAQQRDIIRDATLALTNDSPAFITLMERLAEKQAANADLWIPLKSKILQALEAAASDTNAQQQAAALAASIEATRDSMKGAAAAFRDLDTEGYASARLAEDNVYMFWKAIAPFDMILQEDILRQTNIIDAVSADPPPDALRCRAVQGEQNEAADLTRLFIERFSQTVPEGGLPQPSTATTNGNGDAQCAITAETRHRILELAAAAQTSQKEASDLLAEARPEPAREKARRAHELLRQIEQLLPRNQSDSTAPQQQRQDQQQQEEQRQENQQQNSEESRQQEQQEPSEQQAEQPQEEHAGEQKKEQDEEQMSKDEIRRLLERALNREKEHLEEKQRLRTQYIAPSPTEKDW